jgi:hypothetical protein
MLSIDVDSFHMESAGACDIPIEVRREMARRARDKKLRIDEHTPEDPTVWNPTQVLNPECGIPFTDITAWHFIADQLDLGCSVRIVELDKPKGAAGYEMSFQGFAGQPRIYVKVRLHKHRIIGRSFHNSTRGED